MKKHKKVKNPRLESETGTKSSQNISKSKSLSWHNKIAKNRGSKWQKSLIEGKRNAMLKPSILRIARLERGFQQEDMISKLSLSRSSYCAIERGRQPVKIETAKLISSKVNRPMSELFKRHEKHDDKFIAILMNL